MSTLQAELYLFGKASPASIAATEYCIQRYTLLQTCVERLCGLLCDTDVDYRDADGVLPDFLQDSSDPDVRRRLAILQRFFFLARQLELLRLMQETLLAHKKQDYALALKVNTRAIETLQAMIPERRIISGDLRRFDCLVWSDGLWQVNSNHSDWLRPPADLYANLYNVRAKIYRVKESPGRWRLTSLVTYEHALLFSPTDPVLWSSKAALLTDMARIAAEEGERSEAHTLYEEAILCHKRTLSLGGGTGTRLSNFAWTVYQQYLVMDEASEIVRRIKLDEAIRLQEDSLQFRADHATSWMYLGVMYTSRATESKEELLMTADFEKALSCYRRVFEIQSEHPEANYHRAMTYRAMGRRDDAMGELQLAEKVFWGKGYFPSCDIIMEKIRVARQKLQLEMPVEQEEGVSV